MIYSPIFTVVSSHGELAANCINGSVLSIMRYDPEKGGTELSHIQRFDVARWNVNNPDTVLNGAQVDILTIGYWYKDADGTTKYEPTVPEFNTPKPAFPFTDDEEINALNLMKRMGGGFAQALATAWLRADMNNRRKLRSAFSGFISDYNEQVKAGHGL